ncbi:MAG TPA: OsmC family protein [Thermoanaerobaculia bacterium]|nr:OsmC family protein [Thermoanaerobaculia bacterium]
MNKRTVELKRLGGFRFAADLGESMPLLPLDEPPPLGNSVGPDAASLLATAIGQCLSASLLLCLQKSHIEVNDLRTHVDLTIDRNEAGRLRVTGADVRITLDAGVPAANVNRCASIFEDYCIVTATVRKAFPVEVEIIDASGQTLYRSAETGVVS